MATFQGGSAVPFTDPDSYGGRDLAPVAPRGFARAGLAAVRGLVKDLIFNHLIGPIWL